MASYNFRLQPILDIKIQEEEKLQKRLADCRRRFKEKQAVLQQLEEDKTKHLIDLEQKMEEERIDLENTRRSHIYLNYLRDEMDRLSIEIQKLEQELKRRREELLAKTREKKSLEKLKEKNLEAYKREMLKKEQKKIDDMAQSRYFHGVNQTALLQGNN